MEYIALLYVLAVLNGVREDLVVVAPLVNLKHRVNCVASGADQAVVGHAGIEAYPPFRTTKLELLRSIRDHSVVESVAAGCESA